jgi:hypothetical protein
MRETATKTSLLKPNKTFEAVMKLSRFSNDYQWEAEGRCPGQPAITLAVYPLRL